uniref:Ribosome maturation factor RimP C-terminal domain-containing protein n=1 Tax=wastewater metagenome TaxID=527639 RepID=A0A0A8KWQ0_9ZZZZ
MIHVNRQDELWRTIDGIAETFGMTVYDLARRGSVGLVVVIARNESHLLDGGDKPKFELGQGGVTSDDCSKVVRELMVYFQAEGERFGLPNEPEIEVCSPGVNRELRLPEHFIGAVGERVKVTASSHSPATGESMKATITGRLLAADDKRVQLIDENSKEKAIVEFLLNEVRKARVDFDFGN